MALVEGLLQGFSSCPSRRATPRVQVALLEGLVQGISSSPPRRVTVRVQVTLLEGLLEGFKSPFSKAYSDGSSKPSRRATPRFLKQPFAKGHSKGSSSPSRRATPRVLKRTLFSKDYSKCGDESAQQRATNAHIESSLSAGAEPLLLLGLHIGVGPPLAGPSFLKSWAIRPCFTILSPWYGY